MVKNNNSEKIMRGVKSYYKTSLGKAFNGDTLKLIKHIPDNSLDLIVTSPPYGLRAKKEYGNADAEVYVRWFLPFAKEFYRVLKPSGSFVLNIAGSWQKGIATRSLYVYELIVELVKQVNFHLAQEFIWTKPAALPAPAMWVTIKRIRVKDAVEYILWFSKTPNPKANNRNILQPYSEAMKYIMKKGYRSKVRPSGHHIGTNFNLDNGGSIPPNFLAFSNTESNTHYLNMCNQNNIKIHPARYPLKLPEFFIKFLTDKGDIVLDPFAGSNVTGEAAEKLGRKWLAFELSEEYLKGSKFRFDFGQKKIN